MYRQKDHSRFFRKPITIALVVLLTLTIVWQVWAQKDADEEVSTQSAEVTRVRRGDLVITANGEGTLEQVVIPLGFSASGELVEIAQPGQVVNAGDVLAALDDQKAQIDLQVAELNWNQLASPSAVTELNYQLLQAQALEVEVQQKYNDVVLGPDVDYYKQALVLTEADYWAAVKAVELARSSSNKKVKARLPRLTAQMETAEAAWEEAKLDLEWAITYQPNPVDALLVDGQLQSVSSQTAAQTDMLNFLAGDSSGLSANNLTQPELYTLQRAWNSLEQAKQALQNTVLSAPLNGTITQVNFQIGEHVNAFQPVLTLVADAPLTVRFTLDESDIQMLSVGDTFIASPTAYPNIELSGVVTKIAPAVLNAEQLTIWGEIQPDSLIVKLVPGMDVDIAVMLAESKNTLLLPLQAVQRDETSGSYVNLVQADGSFKQVPVTLGLHDYATVEVLSGLQDGDMVSIGN